MPPTLVPIDDPDDPRLADYAHLTDAHLRRPDHDGCIVEGHFALDALLRSPYPVRSVLLSDKQADRVLPTLADLPSTTEVFLAPQPVVEATVGFRLHRGVVARADRLPPADPGALLAAARTVLVLEGVNDHENLGGLFRNAAAFGVDAVLLDPTTADPLYRRSVRVSLGHVLRVPFARVSPWPGALADLARTHDVTTVSLTPDPGAPTIDEVAARLATDPGGVRCVALLLGAEGPGLTGGALAAATHRARIDMAPGVDSLNVATAAAVALHVLRASGRAAR